MTEQIEQPASEPRAAPVNRITKSAAVQKLLSRNKGATLAEIMNATHWQPHSARAFLTGPGGSRVDHDPSGGPDCWAGAFVVSPASR